jgi:hypothetical protein
MRKVLLGCLLVSTLLLSGCGDNTKTCTEEERLIDGICIVLNRDEIQLFDSLTNARELDNYTMMVSIVGGTTYYNMSILIDQNKSEIISESGDRIELHKKEDNVCSNRYIYKGVIKENNDICTKTNDYRFYDDFEYQWFEVVDGKYSIKNDDLDEVQTQLEDYFIGFTVSSVRVSVLDNQIEDILLELVKDEVTYTIQMSIDKINNTTIQFEGVK